MPSELPSAMRRRKTRCCCLSRCGWLLRELHWTPCCCLTSSILIWCTWAYSLSGLHGWKKEKEKKDLQASQPAVKVSKHSRTHTGPPKCLVCLGHICIARQPANSRSWNEVNDLPILVNPSAPFVSVLCPDLIRLRKGLTFTVSCAPFHWQNGCRITSKDLGDHNEKKFRQ